MTATSNATIANVSIKMPGGYNLISLSEFLGYNVTRRNYLLLQNQVKFLDLEGNVIPTNKALKELVNLIKEV
jgi:allophanate hydrolase subunit 1